MKKLMTLLFTIAAFGLISAAPADAGKKRKGLCWKQARKACKAKCKKKGKKCRTCKKNKRKACRAKRRAAVCRAVAKRVKGKTSNCRKCFRRCGAAKVAAKFFVPHTPGLFGVCFVKCMRGKKKVRRCKRGKKRCFKGIRYVCTKKRKWRKTKAKCKK